MVLHGLHYNLQLGLRGAATGLKSFHVSQSKIMKLLTLSLKVTLSHHFNMLEGGGKKGGVFRVITDENRHLAAGNRTL